MEHRFKAGDFLFFQLESGFALIRLLGIDGVGEVTIWHLCTYNELFPDVERLETAASMPNTLTVSIPHIALTNRAFESTQVAEIGNLPVTEKELGLVNAWKSDPEREVSDLSIRLLTGLR